MPSIVLLTNMESPYQRTLGAAFHALQPGQFTLACLEPLNEERRELGWQAGAAEPWLIRAWQSEAARQRVQELVGAADAVVRGSVPLELVRQRIAGGGLTFTYTERIFKRDFLRKYPRELAYAVRHLWPLDSPNHHLLAAGAYCAPDMRSLGLFGGRMWKWGYFPSVSSEPAVPRANAPLRLLWAGRMIPWKRVDLLIEAVSRLRDEGLELAVDLIGAGESAAGLQRLCRERSLEAVVRFHPPTSPEKVREAMLAADAYVLPSDQEEGWGAVINEAMASGCCVVASHRAGAAPWLIADGVNGHLFRSGSHRDLARKLRGLIEAGEAGRRRMGDEAWRTMADQWSPEAAAGRLVALVAAATSGAALPSYATGPCSRC